MTANALADMNTSKERDIVIEFEHVQLVRTRTKCIVALCRQCSAMTDFLELGRAAKLFRTDETNLSKFIEANGCHSENYGWSSKSVCLASLIAAMRTEYATKRLRTSTPSF